MGPEFKLSFRLRGKTEKREGREGKEEEEEQEGEGSDELRRSVEDCDSVAKS